VSNEQYPEIFVDELGGLMLGYPISKLTFVAARQVGADGAVVKNKVLTLSISTQSLLNTCKLVLNNARENQELILTGASTSEEKLLIALQNEAALTSTKAAAVAQKKDRAIKVIKSK
jgi:hypothetical protein